MVAMAVDRTGRARDDRRGFGVERATITIDRAGIVVVAGEIDVDNADRLARALGDPDCDVVYLSRVTFFGAAGLRALLSAAQTQPNGRLVLRSPSRAVARLLAVTGVAERFDTIGSRRAPSSPEPSTTS